MNIKIIRRIAGIILLITYYNFPLSAQSSDGYSLFYSVPYFEPKLINPIHGSYYLEGVQANELMYSRLWTWKKDISETSDLVADITPESLRRMLVPDESSIWSWKIKIRPGLKWPDGEPLTSEDVRFSFEVYSADKTGFALKEYLEMFREIRVIDDETIQFYVKKKDSRRARYVLPLIQILPKHKVVTNYLLKNSKFSNEPMGSGPFQFVPENKRKNTDQGVGRIVFEKNTNYHRWKKHSNISYIKVKKERVKSHVLEELADANRDDNWGTLDLVLSVPNSQNDFENLTSLGKEHLTFTPYSSNSWYGIALNCDKPLLQNRNIRMALTYALNIQQIIIDSYTVVKKGGVDESVANRISGPFNPLWGAGDGSLQPIPHNPEEAKNIFMNLPGYTYNKKNKLLFNNQEVQLKLIYNQGRVLKGSAEESVIETIKKHLKKIGITIVFSSYGAKEFANKLASGDFDMAFQYYELGYGGNVAPLFTAGHSQNISRFSDPILTSYLDKYNKSSGVERQEYGKKIHQIVHKEAPYIFLYRLDRIMAYRNELETHENFVPKYFFTHIYEWYFKD